MATRPAPDVAANTLSKVILEVGTDSDPRKMVFYCTATDAADTSTTGHGPEALVAALKADTYTWVTVASGTVENADGTGRTVGDLGTGAVAAGTGVPAISNICWHMIFKDSSGKPCGHYLHNVADSDLAGANEGFQTGYNQSTGLPTFIPAVTNGHWYSKTGYKYVSYVKSKLAYRKTLATGGTGRKLTVATATSFLQRHGVTVS